MRLVNAFYLTYGPQTIDFAIFVPMNPPSARVEHGTGRVYGFRTVNAHSTVNGNGERTLKQNSQRCERTQSLNALERTLNARSMSVYHRSLLLLHVGADRA